MSTSTLPVRPTLLLLTLMCGVACEARQPAQSPDPVLHEVQSQESVGTPSPTTPWVRFTFKRTGLPVPDYQISASSIGIGDYYGTEVSTAGASGDQPSPQPFHNSFTISRTTADKIFSLTHDLHNFNVTCASKATNIADTGKKSLSYNGPDGTGGCSYNYSENKDVQQLTAVFQAIAETLDEGRTLERLHRFDRLGLDAEMIAFSQQIAAGRALEVGTIAACLRSIADDPDVIQRVRTKAEKLLATNPANSAAR